MHGAYDKASSDAFYRSTYSTSTLTRSEYLELPERSEYADLPEHLQISYDLGKNPWENLFMQDFIMIAEFSEHEGPRPLVSRS